MKTQKRIRPMMRVGKVYSNPPNISYSRHIGLMQTHSLEPAGRFYFQQNDMEIAITIVKKEI